MWIRLLSTAVSGSVRSNGTIGLDAEAELVYRMMLTRFRWEQADLAACLEGAVQDIAAVIASLRESGLVTISADNPHAIRAVEPGLALPALAARRLQSVTNGESIPAAAAVERFISLHERADHRAEDLRKLVGLDVVGTMVERLITGVQYEVMMLVPAYAPGSFEFSRQVADAVLRRGAMLRIVWSSGLLKIAEVRMHARWLGARHTVPMAVDRVQLRMIILDRTVAVVYDEPFGKVVQNESALESLSNSADLLWSRGIQVRDATVAVPNGTAQPRSEIVLRLLAEGLTDEAVARRIGVSVRTVRNDVASAMAALNARSRFQAGVRAVQLGLI